MRLALMDKTKDALVEAGLHETVNFAFTSQAWLRQFGMTSTARVLNPLSEESEVMVPSLLPGLVKNAIDNWNHHFGSEAPSIRLFELRPVFSAAKEVRAASKTETGVQETWKLALAVSGPRVDGGLRNEQGDVDFYDLKGIIERLLEALGTKGVRMLPMSQSRNPNPLFHPGQSVEILAGAGVAGHFGLIHPFKARELKLRGALWLAELDWEALARLSRPALEPKAFKSWPQFPAIERDFALLVRSDVTGDKITQIALKAGKPLAKVAKIFDVYRGQQVAQGMTSVAVRVIFYEESRSLRESEAEAASGQILAAWKKELGAELRS
jgi:phenylalanyl-tRNA synthetase beta chain